MTSERDWHRTAIVFTNMSEQEFGQKVLPKLNTRKISVKKIVKPISAPQTDLTICDLVLAVREGMQGLQMDLVERSARMSPNKPAFVAITIKGSDPSWEQLDRQFSQKANVAPPPPMPDKRDDSHEKELRSWMELADGFETENKRLELALQTANDQIESLKRQIDEANQRAEATRRQSEKVIAANHAEMGRLVDENTKLRDAAKHSDTASGIDPMLVLRCILATDLSPHERMTFVAILSHANDEWQAWPSLETIARETGSSITSVKRSVKTIENTHRVTIKHNGEMVAYDLSLSHEVRQSNGRPNCLAGYATNLYSIDITPVDASCQDVDHSDGHNGTSARSEKKVIAAIAALVDAGKITKGDAFDMMMGVE